MPLIDNITRLRDDTLSSLDASHNYYAHTKRVWRIVQRVVRRGDKFTFRNLATGNKVDETELSGLAQDYVTGYLASATFQHFVSLFELYLNDFLRLWLTEYPDHLSAKQVELKTILAASDKDEIVVTVVQNEIHVLSYRSVEDWFKFLESVVNLRCPTEDQIKQLAEIKASRNVLVHNNGIVNSKYVDMAKGHARFAAGENLELPEQYHRESWELIRKVVADMSGAAIQRLKPKV